MITMDESNLLEEVLNQLSYGSYILMNTRYELDKLLTTIPPPVGLSEFFPWKELNEAKTAFIKAGDNLAAILLLSEIDIELGVWTVASISSFPDHFLYDLTLMIYDDEYASADDHELAYQMYASYCASIQRLIEFFDKIRSGSIKVRKGKRSFPEINHPEPLNRRNHE